MPTTDQNLSRTYQANCGDEVVVRQELVDRFNELVGAPNRIVNVVQQHFIAGHLGTDQMDAFFKLYGEVIDKLESAVRPSSSQR